ncbi:MAG: FAD/NAD(P)-binding protein [Candidatus Omnitrophica bacterium]|nr:FAD/NAD(P)-binding protein [Candidatus Omnitrophota bacterium]
MSQEMLTKSLYDVMPGELLKVEQVTELEKYFEISLPEGMDLDYEPGQFVMVSVPGAGEAPISICSSPTKKGAFDLIVRKVGAVTGALHAMQAGDTVGIRGPFGRGFPVELLKGKDLLFVGGGCGNVPLHSLIAYVMDNRDDFGKVDILVGCKTSKDLFFTEEFDAWRSKPNVNVDCTVDQGSPEWDGKVGLITTLIPPVEVDPDKTYAIVVGPPIMYKFVVKEILDKKIPTSQIVVSLERHMKCGVGKCGHCQIEGYYCCQDGPVFIYDEIKHNKEAL